MHRSYVSDLEIRTGPVFSWTVPLKPQQKTRHHVHHLCTSHPPCQNLHVLVSSFGFESQSFGLFRGTALPEFHLRHLSGQSWELLALLPRIPGSGTRLRNYLKVKLYQTCKVVDVKLFWNIMACGLWLWCFALPVFLQKNIQEASKRDISTVYYIQPGFIPAVYSTSGNPAYLVCWVDRHWVLPSSNW